MECRRSLSVNWNDLDTEVVLLFGVTGTCAGEFATRSGEYGRRFNDGVGTLVCGRFPREWIHRKRLAQH